MFSFTFPLSRMRNLVFIMEGTLSLKQSEKGDINTQLF